MNPLYFLFGTLRDPELFRVIAETELDSRPAWLPDMAVCRVEGKDFPCLVDRKGSHAEGVVVSADERVAARLDFYELGFGYGVEMREVQTAVGTERVRVYLPEMNHWGPAEDWSLETWQKQHGTLTRAAAADYMQLIETHTAHDAARAFPQIRMRAASRLRALAEPSPSGLFPDMSRMPVRQARTQWPYTDYFAIREDWLDFPRFNGGYGKTVKRASFMGGDAVTILPYDPVTDSVLMVRQFRHGPYVRGDTNPWTLEPPAGRVDPGEAPEASAKRELFEETGIEAQDLFFVGRYYPSPGAVSEHLYSYVARSDLSGRDGSVGGLDGEAEDIMAHVTTLDNAMGLIESGVVNTGPLILSLQWLALNRDRFQA